MVGTRAPLAPKVHAGGVAQPNQWYILKARIFLSACDVRAPKTSHAAVPNPGLNGPWSWFPPQTATARPAHPGPTVPRPRPAHTSHRTLLCDHSSGRVSARGVALVQDASQGAASQLSLRGCGNAAGCLDCAATLTRNHPQPAASASLPHLPITVHPCVYLFSWWPCCRGAVPAPHRNVVGLLGGELQPTVAGGCRQPAAGTPQASAPLVSAAPVRPTAHCPGQMTS
jgi:hypothetical protein